MRLVPRRQGTHLPQLSFWVKSQEEAREVDHAGLVVDDDHAAGADDGAGRGEALVVDRRVEQVRRHAAAGGAAELHGLELLAVLDAAADVEDDVAEAWSPWAPRRGRR